MNDLDLQFVGVGEVVDRHPEASARDLFDGAAFRVAVGQRFEALWIFAAFAGVGLAADAIHGDRQRLVRFGTNRPEAHRARRETLDDLFFVLDLNNVDRASVRSSIERQQAA